MNQEERNDLVRHRINRAKETLEEVRFQIENSKWNTAANRLYYACYYAVTALLAHNSLSAKTHTGVRQMFALHFIKPGKIDHALGDLYTDIFEMRQTGDYDDFIVINEEKVLAMATLANTLIARIEMLL